MTQSYSKPIPSPQGESDFYWQKAKEHELWLRKCNSCGEAYFYPRDISPCCFSRDTTWIKASGKATLHTFGIVHRAPHPGFAPDVPFVTAIVDLEEGPIEHQKDSIKSTRWEVGCGNGLGLLGNGYFAMTLFS